MEKTVTIRFDDMELAIGNHVEADDTVIITIEWPNRGLAPASTQLDLSVASEKEFMAQLGPWLEAGHVPESPAAPAAAPEPPAAGQAVVPARRDAEYYEGLRAFLDARGIRHTFPSGVAYKKIHKAMYDEYLAAGTG